MSDTRRWIPIDAWFANVARVAEPSSEPSVVELADLAALMAVAPHERATPDEIRHERRRKSKPAIRIPDPYRQGECGYRRAPMPAA